MQPDSCDDVQLLLSKYADNEATAEERQKVEAHTAHCDECACRITSYAEMAAIFSESALRAPEAHLREGVFREIGRQKEESWRKANPPVLQRPQRPAAPRPALQTSGVSFIGKVWRAVTPFAAASVAAFTLLYLIVIGGRLPGGVDPTPVADAQTPEAILPVPSYVPTSQPPPISYSAADVPNVPGPVSTGVVPAVPPASAVVRSTATLNASGMLHLAQPTPVFEDDDLNASSSWHIVCDPIYGYTAYYPPDWWTQGNSAIRTFYPWTAGGGAKAPYWIDLRVVNNRQHLDAQSAQKQLCNGSGQVESSRLRCNSSDSANSYEELYSFEPDRYYVMRLAVRYKNSAGSTGDYNEHWFAAQQVFTKMDGKLNHSAPEANSTVTQQALFINGSDLWAVDTTTKWARAVTSGYGVRTFATSPNLQDVAFLSSHTPTALWATSLYLASIGSSGYDEPTLVWTASEIHDIAWYSDRELLAIAKDLNGVFGLYRLIADSSGTYKPQLLLELGNDMAGAHDIQVSPDRQLITFLAPWGVDKGTDVYAVRPDGTDLRPLISHTDPVALSVDGRPLLAPESQAIKSYIWKSGQLSAGGYAFSLLFTAGDAHSLTIQQKGMLYMAPNGMSKPLINPAELGVQDPDKLQIVHIAYSLDGKLAMTGYYNDYNFRADQLAGLWTADVSAGALSGVQAQPIPVSPHGITDLQWSPGGESLIYRETEPASESSFASRYDGISPFRIVKFDIDSGQPITLYESK